MNEKPVSEQIDEIIKKHAGWKADVLSEIRATILSADPAITEEIKWRMATRPEGLAVWMNDGILCFAEIWKDNIKLIFSKGSHLVDDDAQFNARLKSSDVRAIEFKDGDSVDKPALTKLVYKAIEFNKTK